MDGLPGSLRLGAASRARATRTEPGLSTGPHSLRCYHGVDSKEGVELAGTSTMLALGTEAPDFALPDVT
ncbi:MAG: hypothetical protein ACRDKA_12745, partial [Actinomycetota bacterium]